MTWRKIWIKSITLYHWKFAKSLLLKAIVQSLLSENNEAQQSRQSANWAFIMLFEKDGVLEVWWGFLLFFFFLQNLFQKQESEFKRRNELNIAFIHSNIAAVVAVSSCYLMLVHTPALLA